MKRKICPTCTRPIPSCYCSKVERIENKTKISIIRHPKEIRHPFNTAKMSELVFSNIEIFDYEIIPDEILEELNKSSHTYLVYPTENAQPIEDVENIEHIILLDGTWKKTNKIFFSNPKLSQIETIKLINFPQTLYSKIRRSSKDYSLSTHETISYILDFNESISIQKTLSPLKYLIEKQEKLSKQQYSESSHHSNE